MTPHRQVRAVFDEGTIRVYQACSHEIADATLAAGSFAGPFKRGRMTWIKPSFRWVLYRSGWAAKDPGQHRILAVDIHRIGELVARDDLDAAGSFVPPERPYPLPIDLAEHIGADLEPPA